MTFKRLIEVDLPIKTISAHARREKSIRHGHISTLHIWWARRPLAACRAVLCAALWPDPADPECPPAFREAAAQHIIAFARKATTSGAGQSSSPAAFGRWTTLSRSDAAFDLNSPNHLNVLRYALLDFIGDFVNWDNSTVPAYLETARALTQAAHEALGGAPGTRPLVVDPFAGGGAIPLEALRIGADAFASDLNPVAVLLNKVVLEYIPKYGQQLADEVRKWGAWIKEQAEKELAEFYPKDPDGSTPIAYLWARTIRCEGPACGAEVPLMRSLWLAKKGERSVALRLVPDKNHKRVDFEIIHKQGGKWVSADNPKSEIKNPQFDGTVKRGSATCPVCGYTTPIVRVREQLKAWRGGANDARLFCVVTTRPTEQGRFYRLPTERDLKAVRRAVEELEQRKKVHTGPLTLVPDEPTPMGGGSGAGRAFSQRIYGMVRFSDLFAPRQALLLVTLVRLIRDVGEQLENHHPNGLATAVQTCLAMALDRQADHTNSLCTWNPSGPKLQHLFTRAALPIVWDFAEAQPFGDSVGDWLHAIECVLIALDNASHFSTPGHAECASATAHPLPDDAAQMFFTDPPYYDAVPYSDLSDFFYVWLKRTLPTSAVASFAETLTPKAQECIVDEVKGKDQEYFEQTMAYSMAEGRRVLNPEGVGIVVFAHKSTSGWEAQLQAMIDAGWTMTGSWPIDTEMGTRLRALDSAALASSIHLVCRPRENPDGSLRAGAVGDWRDVLAALPKRIHEWMPRLAKEGVVGADAIFACLGPALEIFSQYERVETAGGKKIELREYLEHVWAAVGREALNQIFAGADPTGFEEDGRLTALWLWTMGMQNDESGMRNDEAESEEEGDEDSAFRIQHSSFALEYDTARKLAQGIGAHLEDLSKPGGGVAIKGESARLLAVTERRRALFGMRNDEGGMEKEKRKAGKRGKGGKQLALEAIEQQVGPLTPAEDAPGEGQFTTGQTTLDRIHQSMLLFGEGRSEALKRFLVDDGVGKDSQFWRLAQALSALYPAASQEKRWVDGVLARKKGLGL